ncbi:PKD domain-containing protein [Glutamicibacter sp. V16R2B1]|nr:PKD domain-containing protein [Glutamicibacter sp. V16R2B1]MCK9901284.1 PKD domain-containing protein [Frankia sp. Cpl3]TLK47466.1 hypothetical protein FDN03_15780 [Glutamicibacter sp. V16R2B1]
MTIAWSWTGTAVDHATAPSPAYPASGVAAGDQVLLVLVNKPETATPSTPSGWTQILTGTGGSGAAGSDTGPVRITVLGRTATGSEASTTVPVTVTSANGVSAVLVGLTKTAVNWLIASAGVGSDTTANTTLTATAPSTIAVASGDYLIGVVGLGTDSVNVASGSTTVPGTTIGTWTERVDIGHAAGGDDRRMAVYDAAVTAGTSSGAATITFTLGTSAPGAVALLRLRESSNAPPTANAGPDQLGIVDSPVTLDGTGSSDPDGTIAAYAWTQVSGPAVTLSSASAAQPTFTPTAVGSYTFGLIVTDNGGDTSLQDTVTISVVLPGGRYHASGGSWTWRQIRVALSGVWS